MVLRDVAVGPRSSRPTSECIARAALSTQWKPRLLICITSPQPLISSMARMPLSMRMLACYQGIEKREEMQGLGIGFRVAMRPVKPRVPPDIPKGPWMILSKPPWPARLLLAVAHIRTKWRASVSGDQTAVRLSEDPTAGQMPKSSCKVNVLAAPLEPIHDKSQVAMQFVIGGLVCPLRARIPPNKPTLVAMKVKLGLLSLRSSENCSSRANGKYGPL